jgi:amino acid transporter
MIIYTFLIYSALIKSASILNIQTVSKNKRNQNKTDKLYPVCSILSLILYIQNEILLWKQMPPENGFVISLMTMPI